MEGYVHSVESFGTVDGPGVRMVVFLQGCPLRCAYCHNPDTWERKGGTLTTVEQLLERYRDNRSFYEGGGITVSGGEPLMQMPFVTALFEAAHAAGIHTCLDTSGAVFVENQRFLQRLDRLLAVTDLVLLDIKHVDPTEHRRLTGRDNRRIIGFARYLDARRIPMWIRHVLVPTRTDDPSALRLLGRFIGTLSSVRRFELLPYHRLGEEKYRRLGLPYALQGIDPPDKRAVKTARHRVIQGIYDVRCPKTKSAHADSSV